jgi:hypothetical protein
MRDAFYNQIITRLQKQLDPELFEQCAADLLRVIYPSLVPIHGGSDSGMDGAIADGKGEPFPLVTTTSSRVIDNLTRNLTTYIQDGGRRRKVILATSQALTPAKRTNLFQRARNLGFTLIQIHDQQAFANLLYRNPRWCQELLGLSGDPPALSAVPRSDRPLLSAPLIGRDEARKWLFTTNGDRLLIGQPGSGKTALLNELVQTGEGLFVVGDNMGQIANELRSEQPQLILVDDAHLHLNLIRNLLHLRGEINATFSIVANCWPGARTDVEIALQISSPQMQELQPLTRNEMVEVIKATGIAGPTDLIRELVDQSDGRPGLAVTLSNLCLRGGVREVISGSILARSLLQPFVNPSDRKAILVMGAFALGGNSGMRQDVVERVLGLNRIQLWELVSNIATGGIFNDEGSRVLTVHPEPLRFALVREAFFVPGRSFPTEELLAEVQYLPDALRTLIGARARGACISNTFLVPLLEKADSAQCWEEFAWLGDTETKWVLERYPLMASDLIDPVLHRLPERAIPLLLRAAVGDQRVLHATPKYSLRVLEDWVNSADPQSREAVRRRELLLRGVERWIEDMGDMTVALRTLPFIMLPTFEARSSDPGAGLTITLQYGYLPHESIEVLKSLWPRVHRIITCEEPQDWSAVRRMIKQWAYPSLRGIEMEQDRQRDFKAFAGEMLRDLLPHLRSHPGLMRWAARIADESGQPFDLEKKPLFELLYPEDRYDIDTYNHQESEVRQLAKRWVTRPPSEAIADIVAIEQAARLAEMHWPRFTPVLLSEIADLTHLPLAWCEAAIDAELSSDLVEPLLRASAQIDVPAWEVIARRCLELRYLRNAAIGVLLILPKPPQELLRDAFDQLSDFTQLVKTVCIRGQVPASTLKLLFQHPSADVAGVAAWGAWYASPRGSISPDLFTDWRQAVIVSGVEDYALAQLFTEDPSLAFAWLDHRLADKNFPFYKYEKTLETITEVLSTEQRRSILIRLQPGFHADDLVPVLVGSDLFLFQNLLSLKHLERYHFRPLARNPDTAWIEMAKLVLKAGHSHEQIADAVHDTLEGIWAGSDSAMWLERAQLFEPLCKHDDPEVKMIGEVGRGRAMKQRDQALAYERNEAVRGRLQ